MLLPVISSVFLFTFTATAMPFSDISSTSSSIEKRDPGCVYICDQTNFSGNCWWTCPGTSCVNLDTVIRSFGPDAGIDASCQLFTDPNCETVVGSGIFAISYPGTPDVFSTTNFVPGSYNCYAPPQ